MPMESDSRKQGQAVDSQIVITRWGSGILVAQLDHGHVLQLHLEPEGHPSLLNNIYIGKVKNVVKNIGSAFVDLGDGQTGYYSLPAADGRSGKAAGVKPGDEVLVQVAREAVKTKALALTSNLSFPGRFLVLTSGNGKIGFSGKIKDADWKEEVRGLLLGQMGQHGGDSPIRGYGVIVRTNAKEAPPEAILAELRILEGQYQKVLDDAAYRTCYSLLWQGPSAYVASLRDTYAAQMGEVVTDDSGIFKELKGYLAASQPEDLGKLRLYEDPLLPLAKVYRLDAALEKALARKVWLKSGGYLVIEPTEALVVIDVNTGKYAGRKDRQGTIRAINLEAAEEIGRQMRLRNLSGIILVDFIDMEEEGARELLMARLRQVAARDPVKTTVVDMTALYLVEMTRKRIRKPLYEQVREL